jgi:A/G-specific adenine glycosylase
MESNSKRVVAALIDWYKRNGRKNLPWRRTRNPYRILIAELMLQKTHAVQQVLPVYRNFMEKYPNVKSLSKAGVIDLKEMIKSLGLQNVRSKRLKEMASVVNEKFGGEIPQEYNDLRGLPGVGDYIANAVLCLAFDKPRPMVDANVGRVLGRVFYGKEDYPPSKDRTWKIATHLLPERSFREFNLGIIDLGALICKPQSPHHEICPIREECRFFNSINQCGDIAS